MAEGAAGSILAEDGTQQVAHDGDFKQEQQGWSAGLDEEHRQWVGGMGLDKLPEKDALVKLATGYRAAEKKLGVPADQLLRIPGADAKPEEWRQVWSKLGAPETPDGYELKAPDGQPDTFAKTAAAWFHEHGVPKAAAAGIAAKWNAYTAEAAAAQEAQLAAKADAEVAALRAEWGAEADRNIELARRVRRAAGLSTEEAIAMERSLGVSRAAKVFAELGKAMGEHRFADGGGTASFGMSPEGARARIADLRKDQQWMSAYLAGDADKKAEWTRLFKVAYPEGEAA